jgi:glutathione S-transferase
MLHEIGLAKDVQVIHHETSPTLRNETVFGANPLGKVPVLILDDGTAIFDSTVICDYLDRRHEKPSLIPAEGAARIRCLRLQAVAQGLADSGITLRWELTRRPEALRWPAMAEGQCAKLLASYDYIEREQSFLGPLDLGQIALATSLSWIEFRDLPSFRGHPQLARWYDDFSARPSMLQTAMHGETVDV